MPATLDARTLRDAMSRYLEALDRHREEIDSLNVYPVPDGDTGTNLLLTQRAVAEALAELDGAPMTEVAEAISRAALMGARGNSGVILSQVLRGMCTRLSAHDDPSAQDLAEALAGAAEEARAAVADPVEGTMLTVLRDAAEAAAGTLAEGASCAAVARAALDAATASLERTREQLPVLAAAGVVDAGAKGVVLLFDALSAALDGRDPSVDIGPLGPVGARAGREPFRETVGLEYGFEVMYLLETDDDAIPGLKRRLAGLGDSLVVVGGGGMFNVHVHTNEPGLAVEEALDAGRPRQIRITSLTDQVEEACLAGQARAVREPADIRPAALVAVAEGQGFVELFRSLGAVVVEGGPGGNPSVGDLVAAFRQALAGTVFVLPNHANVIPAAR
ncbi:MAG TPA: DAK2 domain-containing protein, partial [Actinomycetota bacterium]